MILTSEVAQLTRGLLVGKEDAISGFIGFLLLLVDKLDPLLVRSQSVGLYSEDHLAIRFICTMVIEYSSHHRHRIFWLKPK